MLIFMSRKKNLRRERKQRHENDRNVLEMRYNNLTSWSIFIYCPNKAEEMCVHVYECLCL